MWLNRTTAPLLYGAALLLVSVAAPAYGLPAAQLSGVNLALTACYLVWLFLAVLPRLKRRWLRHDDRGRTPPADSDHAGPDLGDAPLRVAPGRSRVRVLRATRKAVDDA